MPPKTTDVGLLTDQVAILSATIRAEKDAQQKANAATRRGNLWRSAAIVLLVLALGLVVRAVHEINQARTAAKVGSCVQDNRKSDQINAILIKVSTPPAGVTLSPEQQAKVDAFRKLEIPQRDCTPAGIAAYYRAGKP